MFWIIKRNIFQEQEEESIAAMLRATAEQALIQTGFVFDETTGLYYDHNTHFYYDSVCHNTLFSEIYYSCLITFS